MLNFNVFIIGGTQTGKSTLAKHLAKVFGLQHVSASEWAKRSFVATSTSLSKQEVTNEITEFSKNELRKDPDSCISYIRATTPIAEGNCVIEGIRNPRDFSCLFNPARDVVVTLKSKGEVTTTFELEGLLVIERQIDWLCNQSIMDTNRSVKYSLGNVDDIPAVLTKAEKYISTIQECVPTGASSSWVNAEIPLIPCFLRQEFLYNLDRKYSGSYIACKIFAVSSYQDHVPTVQVLLDNGSVFSYIPPHAIKFHLTESSEFSLKDLVYHNCPMHEFSVHVYSALNMPIQAYLRHSKQWTTGKYLFTIEWYRANDLLHAIQLQNGQLAFLPQHKLRFGVAENSALDYKKLKAEFRVNNLPEMI